MYWYLSITITSKISININVWHKASDIYFEIVWLFLYLYFLILYCLAQIGLCNWLLVANFTCLFYINFMYSILSKYFTLLLCQSLNCPNYFLLLWHVILSWIEPSNKMLFLLRGIKHDRPRKNCWYLFCFVFYILFHFIKLNRDKS